MTLQELKDRNPDIILDPVEWDGLAAVANGQALFYASMSNGTRGIMSRKVLAAGQVMTAGMDAAQDCLYVIRSTAWGNVKAVAVAKHELGTRVALFRTAPIAAYDRRNMEPWQNW